MRSRSRGARVIIGTTILVGIIQSGRWLGWQQQNGSRQMPVEVDKLVEKPRTCDSYNGILHIEHGDEWAAGTAMFFCYVINYLIYAEEYNLLPWIHLDEYSERIYDPEVHGKAPERTLSIPSRLAVTHECGEEQICQPKQVSDENETITVKGNGAWASYFEPVSSFSLENPCQLPYLTFSEDDMGRMHYGWLKSVRAWHYIEITPKPEPGRLHEWYGDMRYRGASIVKKYFHPKPWLKEAVDRANPSQQCMSMHLRFTDKSGGRELIGVDDYRPYAIAYAEAVPNGSIYLATDSSNTMKQIKNEWPPHVVDRIIVPSEVVQSGNETGVFDVGQHHRTNSEVLTDVYAMAKCSMLLHGHSSVSESVVYVNPSLHECSVDLEDPDKPDVRAFGQLFQGNNGKCLN